MTHKQTLPLDQHERIFLQIYLVGKLSKPKLAALQNGNC